ncbi:DNA-processing protein DprA [Leifsonia naganoensis]|uniref:DNA processing protein n=1 Tax=Leifsonia naganoensis TaxID=150025 RepID=A0A853DYC8_9MICO|nr:DNA-processing protein DprA [Leifsonia naganoensis]NYK12091.1 DNA processing protein [Leifsonia naganoensis]
MSGVDTFVGVPHRTIAELLAAVSVRGVEGGPSSERAALEVEFARVALGTMIEPGDTDAGALVNALGPAAALLCVVEELEGGEVLGRIGGDASSARQRARMTDALTRWRAKGSPESGVRALEMAAHVGARLLTPEATGWPEGLSALGAGEPLALWLRGDPERLAALERSVSLVGARAATGYGEHVAMESAAGLGDRGFAIVSGGAYGIDGAAHRAAVASGHVTVAFLAGGVDRLYPAGHSDLLRRVAETGLLVGELPCGSTPTRWRFLMRNRLIAAVSGATVVVEAGHRSGSLNTAGHAAEIGRPLGAVPGPVTSPASAGCHRLIREYAATCVTTVDEMAEIADPLGASGGPDDGDDADGLGSSADDRAVLAAASIRGGRETDELSQVTGLTLPSVTAALGRLSLSGAVRSTATGWEATR